MSDNQQHLEEDDIPCIELVELVTAYLDDALPDDVRDRVDAHLEGCDGCRNVVEQVRAVIDLTGRLTESDLEELDPLKRDVLMSTFRQLRRR